ncbi:secretagogin isoform X5 [Zalophus californianus]|uniref:Secretagogin isoform X5 n=1 Tax=Zalophus californianus TaxID=9704 RepID=A0A6J2DS86_ZALCA|nr:secretagogin isoform X5 [Zalophus californianus]
MDSAREGTQGRLDAAGFWQVWQRFDADEKGYIEEKELDAFFHHVLTTLGTEEAGMEENVRRMKQQLMAAQDVSRDGRVQMKELANMFLSEDENFLLLFRQETPLDSSVEFMQMKIFDKNKDGRLDLNDLARILALQENFLLQFKMDACSTEERKRDFEKIFAHYDVSRTGALEGPEVDGFVKDMMELVQPSISGLELDKFREILLRHCDVNKDGKIQKSELALCLGLKINP